MNINRFKPFIDKIVGTAYLLLRSLACFQDNFFCTERKIAHHLCTWVKRHPRSDFATQTKNCRKHMILLLALGSSTDSCQELDIYAEHLEKQVFHYFPA